MNENITNNNANSVEEVPLDLFSQVSLDDYQSSEVTTEVETEGVASSKTTISIPADAYRRAIANELDDSMRSQSTDSY